VKTVLTFTLFLASLAANMAQEPLKVGMELSYPPFEMTDLRGNPSGICVEIAQALGRHLGRSVVIQNVSFDGLIPALKTGKIDLILSSMTATEERSRSISFSDPYLTTGLCLLVPKLSPVSDITDLDAKGKKIAVKKGTTGHLYATRHLKNASLLVLDKESAAVLEVLQDKADAFIYDQMSVFQHAQKHPEQLRALLRPFQTESWAIGLAPGDTTLKIQVNAFLAAYRKEGGFDRLGEKYLKEPKAAFRLQGVPFVF
jgi:polar amino acid transport system substrate-binding protein